MGYEPNINRNSSEYIRWIQSSLNKLLGLTLKVDGIMGPQTRSAIRSFQQKKGLVADGVVGQKTEGALRTALGEDTTTPPLISPPAGQTTQKTIYGWSQYKRQVRELQPDQQAVLTEAGNMIIASFKPCGQQVRTVQILGHADYDTPRNLQREQQMSVERAQAVDNWLKAYVGNSIAARITWDTRGVGATQLKAEPTTEANRKQNRRVEIYLNQTVANPPGIQPRIFMVFIQDGGGKPLALKRYKLEIEGGNSIEGVTDLNGLIEQKISENASKAKLSVWLNKQGTEPAALRWDLDIGHIDPVEITSGIQIRLRNLGYYTGKIDNIPGPATKHALRQFQRDNRLPDSGNPDIQTRNMLVARHRS